MKKLPALLVVILSSTTLHAQGRNDGILKGGNPSGLSLPWAVQVCLLYPSRPTWK